MYCNFPGDTTEKYSRLFCHQKVYSAPKVGKSFLANVRHYNAFSLQLLLGLLARPHYLQLEFQTSEHRLQCFLPPSPETLFQIRFVRLKIVSDCGKTKFDEMTEDQLILVA